MCSRDYQRQLETCPCELGCPQGCPCPDYQCPSGESTTTTTQMMTTTATNNMAMLFLSTYKSRNGFDFELSFDLSYQSNQKNSTKSNTPQLIDTAGVLSTNFDFNGQEVFYSCGVTFQNKHFIFGGSNKHKRQIIQINDCDLIEIGSISFDHYSGACGSTDEMVILCFNSNGSNDYKRCRQASSPNGPWTQIALSTYKHSLTSIANSPGN